MDIRNVIDARDALQRRLDKTREEYRLAGQSVTSAKAQAKLSRLAKLIEKLETGIERLTDLACKLSERRT